MILTIMAINIAALIVFLAIARHHARAMNAYCEVCHKKCGYAIAKHGKVYHSRCALEFTREARKNYELSKTTKAATLKR